MDTGICRNLPGKKWEKFHRPSFLSEKDFDECDKIKETKEFKQWMSGINPKTNRKCKPGGKVHKAVGEKLNFKSRFYYEELQKISDISEYFKKVEKKMEEIKKEEDKITEYNKSVDETILKIGEFKWNDFIEFNGKNYGIPEFHNLIHRKDNCGGKLSYREKYVSCECSTCENWGSCGRGDKTFTIFKCEKCGSSNYDSD